jgi:hypothetical protein
MLILPPKQTNKFRIQFLLQGKNIDELSMQAVQVDPIHYNPQVNKPTPVLVVFEDDTQNRVMKALASLWSKKLQIQLEVLDGQDVAMLRWMFDDGYMQALTHGPFDYSLSAAMLVQGEFTCGQANMKVLR